MLKIITLNFYTVTLMPTHTLETFIWGFLCLHVVVGLLKIVNGLNEEKQSE